MKKILSYSEYLSDSLKESLDPFVEKRSKFRIGDQVKVKDRVGKVTAIDKKHYLVLIQGKNERVAEDQIEEISPIKKKKQPAKNNK